MQQTTKQKTPQLKFLAILVTAISVTLVFTITPWNIVPTSVTEDVTVIGLLNFIDLSIKPNLFAMFLYMLKKIIFTKINTVQIKKINMLSNEFNIKLVI